MKNEVNEKKEITIDYGINAPALHVQLKKQGLKNFSTAAVSNFEVDRRTIHRLLTREYITGDQATDLLLKLNDRLFMPYNDLKTK